MPLRLRHWVVFASLVHAINVQAQVLSRSEPSIELADAPALVALAQRAVLQHPQILAAQAAVDSSGAVQRAAERPLFNPELQLDLEDSAGDQQTIGISQTIDISGVRRARSQVASFQSDASIAELAAVRRRLAIELLVTLAGYWTSVGLDELAETRIDLTGRFADLTLERQQAGDLSQVELNIANLAYARARIDHASAESARVGADQLLRAIVPGQLPEVWPELPEALPDVSVEQADADALLSRLPEIQVQRANVLAADARVDLRERERRAKPTVGLMAGTEEDESLIGISFSMPLNVRNRFTYEVAAAQAEKRAAERQADDIEARARGRLITATERYRLTLDAWRSWAQTGQTNLGQQSELLQRLVAAGELSTTDYLVQLNQTLDTAASALELRRQMWLAWLEWLAAAGRIEAWLGISTGD